MLWNNYIINDATLTANSFSFHSNVNNTPLVTLTGIIWYTRTESFVQLSIWKDFRRVLFVFVRFEGRHGRPGQSLEVIIEVANVVDGNAREEFVQDELAGLEYEKTVKKYINN